MAEEGAKRLAESIFSGQDAAEMHVLQSLVQQRLSKTRERHPWRTLFPGFTAFSQDSGFWARTWGDRLTLGRKWVTSLDYFVMRLASQMRFV